MVQSVHWQNNLQEPFIFGRLVVGKAKHQEENQEWPDPKSTDGSAI